MCFWNYSSLVNFSIAHGRRKEEFLLYFVLYRNENESSEIALTYIEGDGFCCRLTGHTPSPNTPSLTVYFAGIIFIFYSFTHFIMNLCSYSNLLPHSVIKYEWLLRNDEIAMLRIYQKQNYDSAGELIDATSIRQYIELKKQTLKPAIIYCKEMRELLGKAFEARRVKYERKKEACEDICAYLEHTEKSLEVLEKQPYLLWDNIYWEIAYFKIPPQKACEAAVIFRLKGPAYEQASKHNDYIFRQAVLGKYNAVRTDLKLAYCHLTGWHPIKDIEAACIVPIDLESEELSYLFAVDDLLLFDSSNGKPMPML